MTRNASSTNILRLACGLLLNGLLLAGLAAPSAFADSSALVYDPAGNVLSRTSPLGTTSYTYDALNRVTSEAGLAGTQSYTYDANSNRLSDGLGSYTYSANRMATRHGFAVTVDAAGHVTADGLGHVFVYNQAGRLYQVLQGTTLLASYYYDYKGERTRKVTTAAAPQGAQTVIYSYDEAGHLLEESTGTGAPIRTYIWRDDTPLAQIDHVPTRRIIYFDVDQLNTPRAARDQSGNVVWRWESDAFGSTPPNENPNGTGLVTVNLRFPGQYYDQESGLYYNGNRDYDAGSGRYVQSDPIGLVGGINTYTYALNNPLRYTDPTGQIVPAIVAACAVDPACVALAAATVIATANAINGTINAINNAVSGSDSSSSTSSQCPADNDREKHCDELLRIDTETCNGITRRRGAVAGEACHASASQRYAACLRGNPLPPLNTWNN